MRLAPSSSPRWLLAALAGASLLAACGNEDPPTSVPAGQRATVATATPYPQPPIPTIVDASGRVSGSGEPLTGGTGSGSAIRETNYTVEAGDTLLAIATQFDTTIEAIVKRNNISDPTALKIGQQLIIPSSSTVVGSATPTPARTATPTPTATASSTPRPTATATASPTPTATATATSAPGQTQTYIVQSGDNSFDIAGRFGITVEELAQANNRTVASLASIQIGDRLLIPPRR